MRDRIRCFSSTSSGDYNRSGSSCSAYGRSGSSRNLIMSHEPKAQFHEHKLICKDYKLIYHNHKLPCRN